MAPILELRRAIVTRLRAAPSVTSLGSPALGARIYGERAPARELVWPFVRYGISDAVGEDIDVSLHVFSRKDYADEAGVIMQAISDNLDGAVLTLGDGRKARLRADSGRIIPDAAEQSAWHGIVRVRALVSRECATA